MTVEDIESFEDFKKIINGDKPVVIDFWATWCGPCKAMAPVFKGLSEITSEVAFYKVDIDKVPLVAEEVGIKVVPSFMYFKNGEKVDEVAGAIPAALKQLVTQASGVQ